MVVLFVMVTLAMVGLSFAYRAGIESRQAVALEVRARLHCHAASAATIAMARILDHKRQQQFDHPAQSWCAHGPLGAEGWDLEWSSQADGGPARIEVAYQVIDEAGKLNLLTASEAGLGKIGMTSGQAASLFDWMDADDMPQSQGAEQQAYLTARPAYRCKNGEMEVLDELLRIRGFGRVDYYGPHLYALGLEQDERGDAWKADGLDGVPPVGWVDLCTCFGDGRVNLNTAPKPVLETLPITEEAVGQILAFRRFDAASSGDLSEHCFRSHEDIAQLQGLSDGDRAVLGMVGRVDSDAFRIFAGSRHVPTGMTCRVEVVVRVLDEQLHVVQWKVNP